MRNKRLNPWGSAMIIAGVVLPMAAFFSALWQNHPDPSAFTPGELRGLRLTIAEGRQVFECEETGEILSAAEIPVAPEREAEYQSFFEERVYEKGRLEVYVVHIILGGLALAGAGTVLCSARRG